METSETGSVAPPASNALPLAGLVVIDLSHVYNGPYATLLMALAGARVIKVEPPGGEHLRSRGDVGGAEFAFAMLNSNKDCITLNLKTEDGVSILKAMAAKADVVVENFAPGVAERLGIGPAELMHVNPGLVYGSSSGYGKNGPYRDYPAMDLVMQAMSGVMSTTGFPEDPPVKAGAAICDFSAGIHLYAAIMTALFQRQATGQGRVVEVSMQDAIYSSFASNLGILHALGASAPARTGNRHGGLGISPYNAYACSDGYVVVNCPGDQHFASLAACMGRTELAADPRFATRSARVANMNEVDAIIGEWTLDRGAQEVFELLMSHRVPCAPVRSLSEVSQDENMRARGTLCTVEHPELGLVNLPHSPLEFEGSTRVELRPSRPLGADTADVLEQWLGLSADEVTRLRQTGVI